MVKKENRAVSQILVSWRGKSTWEDTNFGYIKISIQDIKSSIRVSNTC